MSSPVVSMLICCVSGALQALLAILATGAYFIGVHTYTLSGHEVTDNRAGLSAKEETGFLANW